MRRRKGVGSREWSFEDPSLEFQEYVLEYQKRLEERYKKPPKDAVWVRVGNGRPGFLLRPDEAKRLEEVVEARGKKE
ncbi:MAG: hypothetical protein Q4D38_01840 [Planctomycetia bacterium]|nr:hypothetical protein [Planctomycetia bacterium]